MPDPSTAGTHMHLSGEAVEQIRRHFGSGSDDAEQVGALMMAGIPVYPPGDGHEPNDPDGKSSVGFVRVDPLGGENSRESRRMLDVMSEILRRV